MTIAASRILVLGGYGLVGTAVSRELLRRSPSEIFVHSLRQEEADSAAHELQREAWPTEVVALSGDVFVQASAQTPLESIRGQLDPLTDESLRSFLLYQILDQTRPDIVVDCINTATAIAYRDIFRSASRLLGELDRAQQPGREAVEGVLESLCVPRLIRHIQVLFRGMTGTGVKQYIKVGTTGTGGMGLNIPYTHSEEKPSRVLLSKSAIAGAHSMLLFLMARTPGAPITKEIKPAAAIAWKRIGYGPIIRRGEPLRLVEARPQPLGARFSTVDEGAATLRDEVLESVYIDTGENGLFSLEEFSALTTGEQMEFVTPEEVARHLVFELEGGNTGHDVINALDNVAVGPSYRAGLMRHWALEKMIELEQEHGVSSVAFGMLGPPRLTKLLFEAHLLRLAFGTMTAVRESSPESVSRALTQLVLERPDVANHVASLGIPILLRSGEIVRGRKVTIPVEAVDVTATPDLIDRWAEDGWVDLREPNVSLWIERFRRIHEGTRSIHAGDTSSRHLRHRGFWHNESEILPGKTAGWMFAEEQQGARMK
jgi:hypothetical protein